MEEDRDAPLRNDVRLLGDLLGEVLETHIGKEGLAQIQSLRELAKKAKQSQGQALDVLKKDLEKLSSDEILSVVRAFSLFLNCANLAEQYHRIRRINWHERQEDSLQLGSLAEFFEQYFIKNADPAALHALIPKLQIDLVLTAHPTEVMRRTLMQKYDRISQWLEALDNPLLTPKQRQAYHGSIKAELTAIWLTDEIRHDKPTPVDEARWGLAVIEANLWHAVPKYMREFSKLNEKYGGQALPLEAAPFRFSSWMGGDRDGNPNVTAAVTTEVCWVARWKAIDLYLQEINALRAELSMNRCDDRLRELVGDQCYEPYRALLKPLKQHLEHSKLAIARYLAGGPLEQEGILDNTEAIKTPLEHCYRSLKVIGAEEIAEGHLLDLFRRLACFGLTLTRLDLRQESGQHARLMSEITLQAQLGSYSDWPEAERMAFLQTALFGQSTLKIVDTHLSDGVQEIWKTFQMIATTHPDSLGAYVISMTKAPSDILLVMWFQKQAGVQHPLRVVPLFETLQDLQEAPEIMRVLFEQAGYVQAVQYRQEIMIGYSDSAKDAGILAAAWAQYQAQEALVQVAQMHQVELTLFHGRGGAVGRGGGPAHVAVLSQPAGTVQGRLRVTQQGEVIRNRFGVIPLAYRTMELYTTATLKASLEPPEKPKMIWRERMAEMSTVSCAAFRGLLEAPGFVEWFYQVTPIMALSDLAIGSRPAKRGVVGGVTGLRAIPWSFAWIQNRWIIPAWFGVGQALQQVAQSGGQADLTEMIEQWPFFRSFLSLVEMSLAKVDKPVALYYGQRLGVGSDNKMFTEAVEEAFDRTVASIQETLNISELLQHNPVLRRAILVRNPYILPLNLLQVELLANKCVGEALLVTLTGIAAGMRNTG